jgi:hypothetical protein
MTSAIIETRQWTGHAIERRIADGYVNATSICKATNCRFGDYNANAKTARYLESLKTVTGLEISVLVMTKHASTTWVHPRVGLDLARWCCPDFAVWMDGWLLEALVGNVKETQGQVQGIVSSIQSEVNKHSIPSQSMKKKLPEPYVSWRDLGAKREEEPAARGLFESFLVTEVPKSKTAQRRAWSAKPPTRFKLLAKGALISAREALYEKGSWPMGGFPSATSGKKRRRTEDVYQEGSDINCGSGSESESGSGSGSGSGDGNGSGAEEVVVDRAGDGHGSGAELVDCSAKDELLRLRHFLLDEGVWVGVIKPYLSDVANRLLQLKCEETGGTFDSRQKIDLWKVHSVEIHRYLKNVDEDTARRAIAQTSDLYAKRVREELRKAFRSLWSMRVSSESWEMLRGELVVHAEKSQ